MITHDAFRFIISDAGPISRLNHALSRTCNGKSLRRATSFEKVFSWMKFLNLGGNPGGLRPSLI